ncbi:hypothetical protein TSA66_03295 [Noviherbaspirillum autotrophicum]|uniref:Uncharacterized protein n=1 Tax=Noviherbaspirillum autotrophicum TaxID=709839 RepID=A0A0C2BFN5_9BURK|nr:hypothetical protein TSA66_03295 [Noviherbaspirillum autotrophicum]
MAKGQGAMPEQFMDFAAMVWKTVDQAQPGYQCHCLAIMAIEPNTVARNPRRAADKSAMKCLTSLSGN